ncbi:DUF4892 domain-containing protein [Aliamphritea ceti]|uniref:DUF4892 domain-containing protein n=1 Tax=Aliamphritea ceti TaxID=1524258 RepID=UPI0021C45B0E|nr:DUF4892 domain-containing protein [Aliamphritea ceti]
MARISEYLIKPALLGLMILVGGQAFADSDLRGSSDYSDLERYPLSWIVEYQSDVLPDYLLALGKMKKKSGVIAPEASQRLSGLLRQITYRIPEGHSADEAFNFMTAQLSVLGADELFRCKSRQCGNSHQWANQVFGVSRLYGVDRTQSYVAAKLGEDYIALYTVKRGNKRVYLQLDVLSDEPEVKADTFLEVGRSEEISQEWSNAFAAEGSWLPLDFLTSQPTDEDVDVLIRQILPVIQAGEESLVVLGYSAVAEGAMLRSSVYADRVGKILIDNGVSADRLEVIAVGSVNAVTPPVQQGAVWLQLIK